jgi:hypothetical protein
VRHATKREISATIHYTNIRVMFFGMLHSKLNRKRVSLLAETLESRRIGGGRI